jgi:hypothetical protein
MSLSRKLAAVALITGVVAGSTAADESSPALSSPVPPRLVPIPPSASLPHNPNVDAGRKAENTRKKTGKPSLSLRTRTESIKPTRRGAVIVNGGKIRVKKHGDVLRATLTGASYAHGYIGRHSLASSNQRLVQEFDVEPADQDDPRVVLTLAGKIDGYVHTQGEGTASLRLVDATVYSADGGPPIVGLAFPTFRTPGPGVWRCEQESIPSSATTTAGRFVLVAHLITEAEVDGCFKGHAEAIFAPGPRSGTWNDPANKLAEIEDKSFGLAVTLETATP